MTVRDPNASDPASDARADYDYHDADSDPSGPAPDLADRLRDRIEGEVRFDRYSRSLYATDASAYEVTPVGVTFPTNTDDVAAIVDVCSDRGVAVLPRGGGTSLAGQSVNEAVVLDFTRHMDRILTVDPEARTATTQPGVILGELNADLAVHDLKFAPDPAWADKSAIGGAIGNNSTGAHSLQYGKTDAYLDSCEVVLADGTITRFGEIELSEVRDRTDPQGDLLGRIHAAVNRVIDDYADVVRDAYPELKRNVSGYNLDRVVEESQTGAVNLARLLAGSEGTLAVITEATVSLEPVPETKAMALLTYDGLIDAMADVGPILAHDPAAVEVIDDVLLDLAADTAEFGDVVTMLPEGTEAVLLVEFYADDVTAGREAIAGLLADRCPPAAESSGTVSGADPIRTDDPHRAIAALEAYDPADRERFWKLRKSGLPILLSRTTDEKHISFIEDTAVAPEHLPEYVADFRAILDRHDTYASFYAHAGPGVLHVRPLIDTKSVGGIERMAAIAAAVTDLVVEYGGSVSGEHGDGRARTQWNRKLYGEELWQVFRDLKTAFDPDWILNPGQVCGDVDLTEHLRFDPEYEFAAGVSPDLSWENDNGFQGMVELCHGCGGCRGGQATTGGVMCPTYRAESEEVLSTRGRANMLRRAMAGDLPANELFEPEFFHEVLDLCIGCKGCKRDCPSGVDMAKLKAELTHEYHQRAGADVRDRLFARMHDLSRVGAALAPISNWISSVPGADAIQERMGIARERDLPTFHHTSFVDWFDGRTPPVDRTADGRRAVIFPDTHTNYSQPALGVATVFVLESMGIQVDVPAGCTGSGRPPYSMGFLDVARDRARENVAELVPLVDDGWDVVVIEPSDAIMVQHDYRDLLSGSGVDLVADNTYGVMEYLDRFAPLGDADLPSHADETLVYHGHCHQKAHKRAGHAPNVLRSLDHDIDVLDSGCCGMAGSFGYEAEHLSMSRAIGSILVDQIADSPGDRVVASGMSCRTQIADFGRWGEPAHPVEIVAAAIDAEGE